MAAAGGSFRAAKGGNDDDDDDSSAASALPFRIPCGGDGNSSTPAPLHVHFDCFSGAAGDMMLGSLLDAHPQPQSLLERILSDIAGGIPSIRGEFDAKLERVWRGGMGSIAAAKVDVWSKWNHEAAPVPGRSGETAAATAKEGEENDRGGGDGDGNDHAHEHEHGHAHDPAHDDGHDHSHDHDHGHSHGHDHRLEEDKVSSSGEKEESSGGEDRPLAEGGTEKKIGASHSEGHGHSHSHSHGHSHSQGKRGGREGERSHDHGHEHDHGHSHSHSHGHSHDHSSSSSGPLRSLPQIRSLLLSSSPSHIPPSVRDLAVQTFTVLAEAESRTHGTSSPDDVHFHEVGAIDSIVDTVGTLLALHHLGVDLSSSGGEGTGPKVSCSPLPFGEGTVWTDHGQLPVPAFATMRLMVGMKTCPGPGAKSGIVTGELVTPTAAALLKVLTGSGMRVGRPPAGFVPRAVGVGAGTKDFERWPNVVRSIIGEVGSSPGGDRRDAAAAINKETAASAPAPSDNGGDADSESRPPQPATSPPSAPSAERSSHHSAGTTAPTAEGEGISASSTPSAEWSIDRLTHLECNVDDATPELLSHVVDLLLKNGAVDAWSHPVVMKKGRSAWTLHCLCRDDCGNNNGGDGGGSRNGSGGGDKVNQLLELIFRHGTTLGVRIHRDVERAALRRRFVKVQTPYGCAEDGLGGTVDVKLGILGSGNKEGEEEEIVSVKAEFDHCRTVSERFGVPLKTVAAYAERKAREELGLFPPPGR